MSTSLDEIPILDVKGLTENDEDLQQLAATIRDRFTNIGFVGLINHNISNEVVTQAWQKIDAFFALPTEMKLKYEQDPPDKVGYAPIASHTLYNPGEDPVPNAGDYKECLDLFTNGSKFEWPTEVPDMKEAFDSVNQEFTKLGTYVCKLLAIALNLEDINFFTKWHDPLSPNSFATVRFVQYPPIPKGGLVQGQMRCGQHTDFGTITLLIQDEYGGLEVRTRDGRWITTRPPVGTVMVNIGDMMQRWTSDKLVSNHHRVREPEEEHLKQRTRRSLVYFFNPNGDTKVECLDGSNKYPPTTAFEYWNQRIGIMTNTTNTKN